MDKIKSHTIIKNSENNNKIVNLLINFMYGFIGNFKNITSDIEDRNKLTDYTRSCFNSLKGDTNVIYVDIDTIHIKEITDELVEKLDKLNLKYEINDIKAAHFIRFMKYATISVNDGIKIRGFEYNPKRKRRKTTNGYSKIISRLKAQERIIKIDRIRKRFKVEH
jgi:hypothetical protein